MIGLPFRISQNLTVRVGNSAAQLTPGEALRAAERLVRRAMTQMMREEPGLSRPLRRPRPTAARPAAGRRVN